MSAISGEQQSKASEIRADYVQSFTLDEGLFSGRIVRLDHSISAILQRHNFPDAISEVLARILAITAGLGSFLKFQGVLTLQTGCNGYLKQIVADMTSQGHIRVTAELQNKAALVTLLLNDKSPAFRTLVSDGSLMVTLDQDDQRYQSVVEFTGDQLEDTILSYYHNSAQQKIFVKSFAQKIQKGDEAEQGAWRAAAIISQPVSSLGGHANKAEADDNSWQEIELLLQTLHAQEILDFDLSCERILYRLFHEHQPILHDQRPLIDRCRCSNERLLTVLLGFSDEELESSANKDGLITSTCKFCSRHYSFELASLKAQKQAKQA